MKTRKLKKNLDLIVTSLAIFTTMNIAGYYLKDVIKVYDDRFWCRIYANNMKSDGIINGDISRWCENECFSSTLVELVDQGTDRKAAYDAVMEKCR